MSALQSWRKAYGALKDTTTVSLANLNSDFKDLDVAIVKATNHVECPPKERHLRKIVAATSIARPRADVAYCIHALARRLAKTRNWIVALKTLVVIHRLLREGDPTFREELLNFTQRVQVLQLSNFKDDSSPIAWDYSSWVRTYGLFLEERLECFRVLKYDVEAERLSKQGQGPEKGHSRTRELDSQDLLEQLPALQQLLYRLIGCRPEGAANNNYLVQYALALVLKESFKIYCAINDGIINLVDKFFEMPRHEALKALEIYRRAGQQAGSLSDFYENCRGLELARNFQFPTLREPPQTFLSTMEEYVKEAPRMVPVKEPLEFPERLLLTYKPEESEEIPEPVPVEEEKPQAEEPTAASTSSTARPNRTAAVCCGVVILPMARKQHVVIFTTASLPWMTGTAVNPLFRAAYLAKAGDWEVTLVVPWLSKGDQVLVYPNKMKFGAPTEQESYVRRWLEERIGMLPRFDIKFYPGKFSKEKRSILPVGDITQTISDDKAYIAVLEEPEHLTWYHHGQRWKNKFQKVIGVVHTNYLEYVKREKNGYFHAFVLKHINSWVTDIYCHKVIRLSAATQDVPRSVICNVHGVNPKFIEIGKLKHRQISQREQAFFKGAYYIGKMVWSKGYTELLQLLQKHQKELSGLKMELYGSGEDADEVKASAEKLNLDVRVYPGRDHGDSIFHDYKVFINPSTTDVVCTTTAEALAMGKIVICANHPSNEFFKRFPNCHMYNTEREFVRLTMKAMAEEPIPLSEELRHELSWEAATERFVRVADIAPAMPIKQHPSSSQHFMHISPDELKKNMEEASAFFHNAISGIEAARCVFGAIPNTLQPDEQQCKELGWRPQG